MSFAPNFHDAAERVVLASRVDRAVYLQAQRFGLPTLAVRLLIIAADRGAIDAADAASALRTDPAYVRRATGPASALVARGLVRVTPRRPGVRNSLRILPDGLQVATVVAAEINASWSAAA